MLPRFAAFVAALFLGLIGHPMMAQTQTTPTPATKDPQATAILSQSLNAAGGLTAVSAIQDYTGTGNITYYWAGEAVQAPATVQGMGTGNYRLDSSLANGRQTWACSAGISGVLISPDGTSQSSPFYNLATEGSRTLPYVRIVAELSDATTSITYIGLVTMNGQPAYQVHFAQALAVPAPTSNPLPTLGAFDLYIDPASFLVTKLVETVFSESDLTTTFPHEIDFSNYQTAGNILAPFTISERINDQETWSITLDSITFNSGLTRAVFNPQGN